MNSIEIKNITKLDNLFETYPLYKNMYPDENEQIFKNNLKWMFEHNIEFICAMDNQNIIAVCAYWLGVRLHSGKYLQIDSLIVQPEYRAQKIGQKLINFIENTARKEKAKYYVLDTYSENNKALKLYSKNNFAIKGFHLMKLL